MVREKLDIVRRNIAKAAEKSGRRPQDITLVCVTKEAATEQVEEAISCGITDIGENRVQDALEKRNLLLSTIKWHFIGHLQTNKTKKAVEIFDLIHSVDSFYLAEAISKEAAKINKVQDILIQVNTSAEQSKFGIEPDKAIGLIEQIVLLNNIKVLGLMTIAPLVDDPEKVRPCFRQLRMLAATMGRQHSPASAGRAADPEMAAVQLNVLSMGMSQDYQVAIEEGSTMVRIGTAIFK